MITPIPFGVHRVHKIHKILRRAVTAGHRVIAGNLISPGIVERVFGNGHDLDMRKTHLHQIIGEFIGHITQVRKMISLAFAP